MGFTANLSNAKSMYRYEDCDSLFLKPANLRRMGWGADKRPLDDLRKVHLHVERGPMGDDDKPDYYDVVLYQTAMARYFKPRMADGKELRNVWYNCHPSSTSREFQWRVLGIQGQALSKRTTEGKIVHVGVNKDAGTGFPVRLSYIDGRLSIPNSKDAPRQLPSTTSPERKEERKKFRKWLRTYEAMAKVMEPAKSWLRPFDTKDAYLNGTEFDPTDLCNVLREKGATYVVNEVFPLGDVANYDQPFMEV